MDASFYDALAVTFGLEKTKKIAASAAIWLQKKNDESDAISTDSISSIELVKKSYSVVNVDNEYSIISEIDANTRKSPDPSMSWGKGTKYHPANIYMRIVIDSIRSHSSMTKSEICKDTSFNKKKVTEILRELKKQGIAAEM